MEKRCRSTVRFCQYRSSVYGQPVLVRETRRPIADVQKPRNALTGFSVDSFRIHVIKIVSVRTTLTSERFCRRFPLSAVNYRSRLRVTLYSPVRRLFTIPVYTNNSYETTVPANARRLNEIIYSVISKRLSARPVRESARLLHVGGGGGRRLGYAAPFGYRLVFRVVRIDYGGSYAR